MLTREKAIPLFQSAVSGLAGSVKTPVALVVKWHSRQKTRRALARLDEYLLRDIGLDPFVVAREIDKDFWQN